MSNKKAAAAATHTAAPDLERIDAAIESQSALPGVVYTGHASPDPDAPRYGDSNTGLVHQVAEPVNVANVARNISAPPSYDSIEHLYVLDTTATHVSGDRVHELVHADGRARPYTFEPLTPKKLPFEIAVRFLKHEGFLHTDEHGEEQPFRVAQKRPEDLEAGEQIKIGPAECIANYDELTDRALMLRAAMLPGSEVVVREGPRARVVKFIVDHNEKLAAAAAKSELGSDEFTPPPFDD